LEDNNVDKLLSAFQLTGEKCHVKKQTHFYDILKVAAEHKLQLVAVVNEDLSYEGVITLQDTISSFAQSAAVQQPGGILVLSMDLTDYSLAEISRLIEENHAKILSCIVKEDPFDLGKIRVNLKINELELSRIVATLERFGYRVVGRYQETAYQGREKEKLDLLFRYLDI
jgi:hypothetical protein